MFRRRCCGEQRGLQRSNVPERFSHLELQTLSISPHPLVLATAWKRSYMNLGIRGRRQSEENRQGFDVSVGGPGGDEPGRAHSLSTCSLFRPPRVFMVVSLDAFEFSSDATGKRNIDAFCPDNRCSRYTPTTTAAVTTETIRVENPLRRGTTTKA